MRSVERDVPVDYKSIYGEFVNIKIMCQFGHSETLIEIRCAFIGMGG